MIIFAHGGAAEETAIQSALNNDVSWYVAIPIYIAVTLLTSYLVWGANKNKLEYLLVFMAATQLMAGLALYNTSVAVSIVAITVGTISAVLLTLQSSTMSVALALKKKHSKNTKKT